MPTQMPPDGMPTQMPQDDDVLMSATISTATDDKPKSASSEPSTPAAIEPSPSFASSEPISEEFKQEQAQSPSRRSVASGNATDDQSLSVTSASSIRSGDTPSRYKRRSAAGGVGAKSPSRRSVARHLQDRGQRAVDGNASMSSSRHSSGGVTRPAGMRERLRERLQSSQSERNLNLENTDGGMTHERDDDSVRSRRTSGYSVSAGSVRHRLSALANVPSIRRLTPEDGNDDALLLQMTQKVRQHEEEKTRLVVSHEKIAAEYETRIACLEQEKEGWFSQSNHVQKDQNDKNLSQPIALQRGVSNDKSRQKSEAQLAKLDKALAKIARLESEQSERDELEEKFQDAQITIANLRLQTPPAVRRLSMGSVTSFASDHFSNTINTIGTTSVEQREETTPEKEIEQGEERKPESPPGASTTARPPMHLGHHSMPPGPRSDSIDTALDDDRGVKLEKLKAFRRSRENQLKELVLDSQHSPTDVQSVIRNLQDEVKAGKEVMMQQKIQLEHLRDVMEDEPRQKESPAIVDTNGRMNLDVNVNACTTPTPAELEKRLLALHHKYSKLEMDRAWGEFQLRDRVTNDALKFHKRLRHWKEQTQELQKQLEQTMAQHASESRELRVKLSRQQQVAVATEEDLIAFKRGTEGSLKELCLTQDRLEKTQQELAKYRPKREDDPTLMQQAKLLESAIGRKKTDKAPWPGLRGIMRRGDTEEQSQAMG